MAQKVFMIYNPHTSNQPLVLTQLSTHPPTHSPPCMHTHARRHTYTGTMPFPLLGLLVSPYFYSSICWMNNYWSFKSKVKNRFFLEASLIPPSTSRLDPSITQKLLLYKEDDSVFQRVTITIIFNFPNLMGKIPGIVLFCMLYLVRLAIFLHACQLHPIMLELSI